VAQRPRRRSPASSLRVARKIFFASTVETLRAQWFRGFEAQLTEWLQDHPGIKWQRWNDAFPANNRPTLEQLLDIRWDCDGAVCILSGDDVIQVRGEVKTSPRDNLLFETGLFLSAFGPSNVLIAQEEGSKVAADFTGVTTGRYRVDEDRRTLQPNSEGRLLFDILTSFLFRLEMEDGVPDPGLFSFIREVAHRTEDLRSSIETDGNPGPLKTSSVGSPEVAYKYALRNTQERFWTTTYLNSAFWSRSNDIIIEANRELTSRFRDSRRGRLAGQSRLLRLVLLDQLPDDALEDIRRKMRAERRQSQKAFDTYCQDLRHRMDRLNDLQELGFDVRVVYDADAAHSALRGPPISYQSSYTELALYDTQRVDVFRGLDEIESVTPSCIGFEGTRSQVEGWIARLLNSPQKEFAEFYDKTKEMIETEKERIDYRQNWLSRYDLADGELGALKEDEFSFVAQRLQDEGFSGGRILDVGTCTGRYVFELARRYESADVVGIDNDEDCIAYIEMTRLREATQSEVKRTRVLLADITDSSSLGEVTDRRPYKVITCMMGTLQHLRANHTAGTPDDLNRAITLMADMLDSDGHLFVSVWRSNLKSGGAEVLGIYTPAARATLMKRFFTDREWESRFVDHGFEVVQRSVKHGKLLVMQLRPKAER
jgi:2-polyprenyl-3-methyl-5-hydroxy-6-metoxy-1,4-benzoquinol methylase